VPWIVAFKAFKAFTLTALGVTLLVVRRSDPVDLLMRIALTVHLRVTSRLFERALMFATNLTVTKETAFAVTAFGAAALMGTEGVGLHLPNRGRMVHDHRHRRADPVEVYGILNEFDRSVC
jgi:hypothetical protein